MLVLYGKVRFLMHCRGTDQRSNQRHASTRQTAPLELTHKSLPKCHMWRNQGHASTSQTAPLELTHKSLPKCHVCLLTLQDDACGAHVPAAQSNARGAHVHPVEKSSNAQRDARGAHVATNDLT